MTLQPDASLGLVGINGAGKTTVVKLLARLYEPSAGRITAGGIDISEVDADEWRRHIAVIFQDFVRYPFSLRENIALGDRQRDRDESALRRAIERAGLTEMIDGLPHGVDTILSRRFTGGAELSGGEWQRVALARCLYAVDRGARIVILDEPTASLDVRGEQEVFDRVLEATRGVTTVLISHRFGTIRHADHIAVLDGGRLVEQGSHTSLVDQRGLYARMYALQARHFEPRR